MVLLTLNQEFFPLPNTWRYTFGVFPLPGREGFQDTDVLPRLRQTPGPSLLYPVLCELLRRVDEFLTSFKV